VLYSRPWRQEKWKEKQMVLRFTTADALLILAFGVLSGLFFGVALVGRRAQWEMVTLGIMGLAGILLFITLNNPIAGGR